MSKRILIIGSTGKLGSKLLKFTHKNSISIDCITCFTNKKKILNQKDIYKIKYHFTLSNQKDYFSFLEYLKKKIDIIYFLDYGSKSLKYLDHFLNFNRNSIIAVANKELIIAGGSILQKKIKNTKNKFISLDSEHFSLINSNIKSSYVDKIYITASGGPFYFKKKIELSLVDKKNVLSHPKWKMGKNNLIDSSNFMNKILEIYELSHIYDIPLSKIDFLVCKEAYIHSVVLYSDGTLSINAFDNDMIITLIKPLSYYYKINQPRYNNNFLNLNNLRLEKPKDKRFKVLNYKKKLMNLNHSEQIRLMIINNNAHNLYLSNKLQYNKILDYIMNELFENKDNYKLSSIKNILKYIMRMNNYYKTNV